jgi:hypothetical protein
MLAPEDFMTTQALVKRGVYLIDIAGQFGIHARRVPRALQRGRAPPPRGGALRYTSSPEGSTRTQESQRLTAGPSKSVVIPSRASHHRPDEYQGIASSARDYATTL